MIRHVINIRISQGLSCAFRQIGMTYASHKTNGHAHINNVKAHNLVCIAIKHKQYNYEQLKFTLNKWSCT